MNKLNFWMWSGIALVGTVGLAAQGAAADAPAPANQTAPAGDEAVRDPAELDQLPVATKQVAPQYPADLHAAKVEGSATLSFVVDVSGDVRDVQTVRATQPAFAKAVSAAVAQWKFEPGRLNGKAVNTRMQIPIAFALSQGKTAAKP
jgi:protein TonB